MTVMTDDSFIFGITFLVIHAEKITGHHYLCGMEPVFPLYEKYADLLHQYFPYKVQKLMLDAGFTCPNRDGTKGRGGCTYCVNKSFNPQYSDSKTSIATQITRGKKFFEGRYSDMRYLAYFQSFTGTYAPLDVLRSKYEEALAQSEVVGLVISTRPDCVSDEVLDYLAELAQCTFVMVEYGVESVRDEVLQGINRQHTYAEAVDAMKRTHERGLLMGVHYILGLPHGNTDLLKDSVEVLEERYAEEALEISRNPIQSIKIHQLQVLKGTLMNQEFTSCPEEFPLLHLDTYLQVLAVFIAHLRRGIAIDRLVSQSPPGLLVAPRWGLKPDNFALRLEEKMREKGVYQGKYNRG